VAFAASAKPNFSGDWKLNVGKSDFGPAPAPDKSTRKIEHNDPSIKWTQVQSGAQGETKSEISYTTDGKETINKSPRGDSKGSAKWEGDTLIIDSKRELQLQGQAIEITQHEVWTLSADGKTLTVNNKLGTPQGDFELKSVFEKQ